MDRLSLPRLFLPLLACLCCAASPATPAQAQSAPVKSAGALADFGDPNLAALAARVRKGGSRLVLTQLGDSHTAADFFTGQLRDDLQADHGDGGIGWLPPMAIPGVLHSRVLLGTQGWKAFDSRTERDVDFPLGGYIARADGPWTGTLITPIDPAKDATGAWRLSLWLRGAPNAAAMTWRDGAEKISPGRMSAYKSWKMANGPCTFARRTLTRITAAIGAPLSSPTTGRTSRPSLAT